MSKLLCICPTQRDHRELAMLANSHTFVHHHYASLELEDLTARQPSAEASINDPQLEVESILKRCRDEPVEGVITTDDYPGTTLAAVVADELKLPSPKPRANGSSSSWSHWDLRRVERCFTSAVA